MSRKYELIGCRAHQHQSRRNCSRDVSMASTHASFNVPFINEGEAFHSACLQRATILYCRIVVLVLWWVVHHLRYPVATLSAD